MPNSYFKFKQFIVHQDRCAMKVTTDACLFGAWVAEKCREENPVSMLEIGTGTGLLSLMVAQKNNAMIDAIELDEDSYTQAKENFEGSPWVQRLNAIEGDVKNYQFKEKYDVILSNPPFYQNELASADRRKNLAMHDGLSIADLLNIIEQNIKSEGTFYLLLPFKRHDEIKTLLISHELHVQNLCFVRQSTNHDYFRIMLKGKLKKGLAEMTEIEEIAIMDDKNQYTSEFINLLKEYYLNL